MTTITATLLPPVPESRLVCVTMTQSDAESLGNILHRVGGSPKGPRGRMDQLSTALYDLGIDTWNNRAAHQLKGSLEIE
jgi:hypothetical protein